MKKPSFCLKALIVSVLFTSVIPVTPIRAATTAFVGVGTTTGACPSGRTCFNTKTVNSCGGSANVCGIYNALSTASDTVIGGANIHADEQRAFNNNSGTQRTVCVFNNAQTQLTLAYHGAGWHALPFTGAGNIGALAIGSNCSVQ
jgi:hypothetical protein